MNGHTLCTQNITLSYEKKIVAANLSLTIDKPQMIAIIGPNGAGKSTLLKSLSRILIPQKGEVLLDGKNIHKMPGKEVAQIIAMLPQATSVPDDFLVADLVSMGRTPYRGRFSPLTAADKKIVQAAMEQTNITGFSHRRVNTLSGGERQRVWLAMAIAQEPKILLLDEPTTFLDIHHQLEIMELVLSLHKSLRITVVMVLHDLNHAFRYSERIIAIKGGAVFADGPTATVLTEENFARLYNVKAAKVVVNNSDESHAAFIPYAA
ncbi:MAG: ABC transporter ATP-binding protein, partial [Sporomusaceae bacterium]|nr:ABC transporter ATP-binding protein [Sporomusaceae bacterium]